MVRVSVNLMECRSQPKLPHPYSHRINMSPTSYRSGTLLDGPQTCSSGAAGYMILASFSSCGWRVSRPLGVSLEPESVVWGSYATVKARRRHSEAFGGLIFSFLCTGTWHGRG